MPQIEVHQAAIPSPVMAQMQAILNKDARADRIALVWPEPIEAVARVLAREHAPVVFSRRAVELMETLREEYDWVEPGQTFLISYDDQSVM